MSNLRASAQLLVEMMLRPAYASMGCIDVYVSYMVTRMVAYLGGTLASYGHPYH